MLLLYIDAYIYTVYSYIHKILDSPLGSVIKIIPYIVKHVKAADLLAKHA